MSGPGPSNGQGGEGETCDDGYAEHPQAGGIEVIRKDRDDPVGGLNLTVEDFEVVVAGRDVDGAPSE